jgi:Flp pilus assembly pilin Flp
VVTTSRIDHSSTVMRALKARTEDEHGQTLSEYSVMLTVITLAIVTAVLLLGDTIGSTITAIAKLVVAK